MEVKDVFVSKAREQRAPCFADVHYEAEVSHVDDFLQVKVKDREEVPLVLNSICAAGTRCKTR
jgi:hypothetical protein